MAFDILAILSKVPKKQKIAILDWPPIPQGATVQKNGKYLRISNCHDHDLSTSSGAIPYHRFVLYEKLGRPASSNCWHCGYELPWVAPSEEADPFKFFRLVINADHLDSNPSNNHIENLVPSCWWCNLNRSWAEPHIEFWAKWRRWMADVPPQFRPDIRRFTEDFGFNLVRRPADDPVKVNGSRWDV